MNVEEDAWIFPTTIERVASDNSVYSRSGEANAANFSRHLNRVRYT